MTAEIWRRCSACKEPIALGSVYWVCNVSTCNRVRTALAFCTVDCWEVHLPSVNHRESWAVERTAPKTADEAGDGKPGRRRIVGGEGGASKSSAEDVLVVATRLKEYIRAQTGLNTSDRVLEPLSDILRRICDEAAQNAIREGRRTVLDRDVPKV